MPTLFLLRCFKAKSKRSYQKRAYEHQSTEKEIKKGFMKRHQELWRYDVGNIVFEIGNYVNFSDFVFAYVCLNFPFLTTDSEYIEGLT